MPWTFIESRRGSHDPDIARFTLQSHSEYVLRTHDNGRLAVVLAPDGPFEVGIIGLIGMHIPSSPIHIRICS